MLEKSPAFTRHDTLIRRLGAGAAAGALALTAVALVLPPSYDASQELPSRQTIGTVTITHSESGVRIITDTAAPEGEPQITSYCLGDELLVIRREPTPAGVPIWDQLKQFEAGAEVHPKHPNCDDRLLTPGEYPDPLATS